MDSRFVSFVISVIRQSESGLTDVWSFGNIGRQSAVCLCPNCTANVIAICRHAVAAPASTLQTHTGDTQQRESHPIIGSEAVQSATLSVHHSPLLQDSRSFRMACNSWLLSVWNYATEIKPSTFCRIPNEALTGCTEGEPTGMKAVTQTQKHK